MKNFVQRGHALTTLAPYALLPGAGCQVGGFFGVAKSAALQGAPVVLELVDVYDLKKKAGDVFAVGALVYWDDAAKQVTSTAAGNKLIGAAWLNAGGADTTARVRLNGIAS